ncbi:hypothetical protein BJ741DRAFT_401154 [Chytriomyces cf. hyalinus JEL632]|nr:hypothetical protein BJ741DRAFT_401154 [Chytriomyces cf. hyalinus JEL632]
MDFQRISTAFAQRAAQLGSNNSTASAIDNNDAVENIEPHIQRARECLHSHSSNEITTRSLDRFAVAAVDIIAMSPFDSERAALTALLIEPTHSLDFEPNLEVQSMRIHTCFHALAARIRPTCPKDWSSRVLSALKDLLLTHPLETFAQADRTAWTLFVAILCLLPDKISNSFASETSAIDAFFAPIPFTQHIIDDILDSRVVKTDKIVSQMALLLTKLCRLNRYDLIASNLIQRAQIDSEPISKLILKIDADQLLKLMLSVLKQLSLGNYSVAKAGRIFESILPNEDVAQHTSAMSIFRDFSMLVKLGEPEIRILCGYYAKFSSKTGLQISTALEECLSLWATASFAKNSTETAHLSLITSILVSLAQMDFNSLEPERRRRVENVVNQGMHLYLSSTVEVKRKSGMVLGECFTKAIRPNTPLSFELDENDSLVKKLRSLVILSSDDEGSEESKVSATGNGLTLASLRDTSKVDRRREKVIEQDPDAFVEDLIAGNESDDESERDDLEKEDADSSNESDGDDLVPLATPDDRINSKKPFYLRDCLKNLRSEDPDIIEVTLQSLSSLVASANLTDLSNIMQDLYPRLLNLQNTYQLDDFELFVQEAIVGMGIRVPKLAAKFLNAGLMEDERMLMGRLAILRYMAFTVTAGRNRGDLVSRNPDLAAVKSTASTSSFSSSLPDFFYPLVDGFAFLYGLNAVEDLAHNILVESFLKTAALIVKCSENTTHCLKMARELLQLALNINFATHDANTKSTLLLVFGITVSAPPKQLLHIEFDSRILNACSEYLEVFIAEEPDSDLVDKAEQLVSLLHGLNVNDSF